MNDSSISPEQGDTSVATSRYPQWLPLAVSVILVALVAELIIYFTNVYISRNDYEKADKTAHELITDYDEMSTKATAYGMVVRDGTASDEVVATAKTDYEKARDAYRTKSDALSNERALKNDKVKAAVDAFTAKNREALAYDDSMNATMPTFRRIAQHCGEQSIGKMDTSDLSALVASYDAAASPCVNAMKELAESKNSDAAAIGKKSVDYFDQLRAHIVAMQDAYAAVDRTKFESEYNAFIERVESFSVETDTSTAKPHQANLSPLAALKHVISVIEAEK